MQYQVSYTVPTKPEKLPEGATVTEVPSLPLKLTTHLSRKVEVEQDYNNGAWLELWDTAPIDSRHGQVACLKADEVRQVRDALTEALGETPVEKGEFPLLFGTEYSDRQIGLNYGVMSENEVFLEVYPRLGSGNSLQKVKLNRDERKRLADSLYASL